VAAAAAVLAATGLSSAASGHSEPPPKGEIEGVAYLAVSGPHRVGSHARPERGIKVTVTPTQGTLPAKSRTTTQNGRFEIGEWPGVYVVTAQVGEPVTNRTHACGSPQHVSVPNRGITRIRIVCSAR